MGEILAERHVEIPQRHGLAKAGQEAEQRWCAQTTTADDDAAADDGVTHPHRENRPESHRHGHSDDRLQDQIPRGPVEGARVLHGRLHEADQRALVQVHASQRRVALRAGIPVHHHHGVRLLRQLSGDLHVHQVSIVRHSGRQCNIVALLQEFRCALLPISFRCNVRIYRHEFVSRSFELGKRKLICIFFDFNVISFVFQSGFELN